VNAHFRYTAGDRAKIRKLLPLAPPRTQTWSSLPLRLPTIVPSNAGQVQTAGSALTMLEQYANMFFGFENLFRIGLYTYRDIEAHLNQARVLAVKTAMHQRAEQLAEMAREAKAYFDARYQRRSQRTDWVQDWYLEKLLSVWERCGGDMHMSVRARGSPLLQFLLLASEPVYQLCDRKLLTRNAARETVRKLLTERRPGRPRA
jgi:hypothetical protein